MDEKLLIDCPNRLLKNLVGAEVKLVLKDHANLKTKLGVSPVFIVDVDDVWVRVRKVKSSIEQVLRIESIKAFSICKEKSKWKEWD